jgi:formamidopyrimidine-DNA glycosylase
MPETPELQAHAERLTEALGGVALRRVEALSFTVLKTFRPPLEAAVGEPLDRVERHGKYLVLRFPSVAHVVHLMQGGRLRLDASTARKPRGGLLRWTFEDGRSLLLTEPGTERRAGVWVVEGDPSAAAPLAELGPEAATIDAATLGERLRVPSARLHTALRDQRRVAGLGRRLANEVCHRARISPFASTGKLGPEQVERVAGAVRDCIAESLAEERARGDFAKAADRTTAVHGRTGKPCPVCGDVVREVAYRAYTVQYCAACQTGGKVLADNTYSRLGIDRDPLPEDEANARDRGSA